MRWGVFLIALCACGGDERPAPARRAIVAPASSEAAPAGPDDPVVATVDGRPVHASCVERQARHLGLAARDALDDCIDFELLAAAADARGLRGDPDVIAAWRREQVRALIEQDLGAMQGLDDLPAYFRDAVLARAGAQLDRPELRLAQHVGAIVPRDAVIDGPEDQAARAVAEATYAELGDADGVLFGELIDAMQRHADGTGVEVDVSGRLYPTPREDLPGVRGTEPRFREAVWAIPAVGRISRPARMPNAWVVILWHDTLPAADLREPVFETARQRYFVEWATRLAADLGLDAWIDEPLLATLAERDRTAALAPPAP